MTRTAPVLALLAAMAAASALSAQPRLSRADADRFQTKLVQIVELGSLPGRRSAPRSTVVTESEVNSYLRYRAADQIPVGVTDPVITALGDGRVAGRAIVDLDAVRTSRQRGWLDPAGYLTGRVPVSATGRLTARDGVGRFELETAEISGITVPKTVLQELVSYYSRTPENPAGITIDDPFELPSGIREIRVEPGRAMIVQ